MCMLRELFWLSADHKFYLEVVYINTKLNKLCDNLSRLNEQKAAENIRNLMEGVKRKLGMAVKRASPILPCHMRTMFRHLTLNPGHISFRAALLTFRGLLQKQKCDRVGRHTFQAGYRVHCLGNDATRQRLKDNPVRGQDITHTSGSSSRQRVVCHVLDETALHRGSCATGVPRISISARRASGL